MRAAALAGWFLLLPGIAQAAEVQVQILVPTAGQTVGRSVAIEAVTVGPVTSVTFEVSADRGATLPPARTTASANRGSSSGTMAIGPGSGRAAGAAPSARPPDAPTAPAPAAPAAPATARCRDGVVSLTRAAPA
jgi:hypothetical protein